MTAKGQNPTKTLNFASKEISNKYHIYDLTLQIEDYKDEMSVCVRCQPPQS